MSKTDEDIRAMVRDAFHSAVPARLGVAVSGGGDSVALLHILSQCFEPGQVELHVATVDHGLRRGSAEEAAMVGRLAKSLNLPHDVLTWDDWDGSGNLQDQARRARYRLLADWAKDRGIATLTVGHTADDQAETVLMRLARASGVSGLSGIPARRTMHGVTLLRPLLALTRAELREYLVRNHITWSEDPSNVDARFERVRIRQALQALEPLGLNIRGLAAVAQNMTQAREALDWYTFLAARDLAEICDGDVVLDQRQFRALPEEIARRLLVQAIRWVAQTEYPPRSAPMSELLKSVRRGRSMTLSGCHVLCQGPSVWVSREYNAVADVRSRPGEIWDNRWRLFGNDTGDVEIRALGHAGLALCDDPKATGLPVPALLASPAVWKGDDLVAAPLAGMPAGWRAEPVFGGEEFFASLLSH